jgi:hypothetical protein
VGDTNPDEKWKRCAHQNNAGSCLRKEVDAGRRGWHLALGPHRPTREISVRLPGAIDRKLAAN